MKSSVTLFLILWCAGCANIVTPPAHPIDPVTVYLLDHGRHPTLILPAGQDRFVRYAYGDWRWYALSQTTLDVGFAALFLQNPGALGRKELSGHDAIDNCIAHNPVENFYQFQVAKADIDRLRAHLDDLFAAEKQPPHYSPDADLFFVHHPQSYSAFHNCNHVMVAWLKELGCAVTGAGMLSIWEIHPASGQATTKISKK